MKHFNLKFLTFFLTALLAFGVGWADELTYTFSKPGTSIVGTLEGAPSGVTAQHSTTATGFSNGGVQVTTTVGSLTVTIKGFNSSYQLKGITLRYCTNSSKGAGTVTAKLGEVPVANDYSISDAATGGTTLRDAILDVTETTFNENDLILKLTVSTNSVYVNKFTVTYEPANDNREEVELSFPNATYNATLGQTFTAPTVTADPAAAASEVTYSSSNPVVASVDENTGEVTLVSAGTTTITAEIKSSTNYKDANAYYVLEVAEDPNLKTAILDFTENKFNLPTSSTAVSTEGTFTDGTYSVTLAGNPGYKYTAASGANGDALLLGKEGAYVILPTFNGTVSKIVVEGPPGGASGAVHQNIYVDDNPVSTETTDGANGTHVYLIDSNYQTSGTTYTLKVTNDYNTQIRKIIVYYTETPTVAAPEFSLAEGTYSSAQSVTITAEEGATIYYTLDGTDPTTESTEYTGAIAISAMQNFHPRPISRFDAWLRICDTIDGHTIITLTANARA